MLVSLNLLCKWLIQLSPFTAVTGISLFPTAWPANGESSARIAIKAFIDVIDQDVVDEDMLDQFFILPFEGAAACAFAPTLLFLHLLRVKSALVSPDADTGLDWFLAPSCQAITV